MKLTKFLKLRKFLSSFIKQVQYDFLIYFDETSQTFLTL
jgi:hypothetical protein